MNFSIIPIAYLTILSIVLTPISIVIVLQVINFSKNNLKIKAYTLKTSDSCISFTENYQIANIYIYSQKWHVALMILENEIYNQAFSSHTCNAKAHNAIGFILQKTMYSTLAQKYYIKSLQLDSNYLYAKKNLDSLH